MTANKPFSTSRRTFVQGSTAAAAAATTLSLGGQAHAADGEEGTAENPYVVKVATVAPPGTPWATLLNRGFKKKVKKASEGRIKIKTYLGGALGDEISTAEACKRGTIQIFAGTAGALAAAVPELDVLELPYSFKSLKHADHVLDDVIREDLARLLWERGYHLMFYSENGYRSIGSNRAVRSKADLAGLKMRSQQSDVHLNTWRALGASPVPMAVTEVLSALQTGVVDGFDNTPLFSFAASWYQAITHFTLSRHIYQAGIVVASRKFWEPLPDDIKKIMMGDPANLSKKGRRGVRAIGPMLIENFRGAGIEVIEPTDGEMAAFKADAKPVWEKFRDTTSAEGKALFDKIRSA